MARRVVHLTSVHAATDTRILERECRSLAGAGYEVTLIAPGGDGDGGTELATAAGTADAGVRVRLVAKQRSRPRRFIRTIPDVYRLARSLRADVYHLHDPELLPVGVALRRAGAKVVYDAHEDYGREILTKDWVHPRLREAVARATGAVERFVTRRLDLVVAATPVIAANFPSARTVLVQNFPALDELPTGADAPYARRSPNVAYVGDLTVIRGAAQMVTAMAHVADPAARLAMAGRYSPPALEAEMAVLPGWERVDFAGWLDRPGVQKLLASARLGLVLFHPSPAHLDARPNKLFEYMGAGLPVVVSDFPAWMELVTRVGCGLAVDPLDPAAIGSAVSWLLDHPDEAEAMGARGRAAVGERYNWASEAARLVDAYSRLG